MSKDDDTTPRIVASKKYPGLREITGIPATRRYKEPKGNTAPEGFTGLREIRGTPEQMEKWKALKPIRKPYAFLKEEK